MTKLKAINELVQYDHSFLNEAKVKELTKPFGFVGRTYLAKDSREDFKGLTLPDGKDMEGQDSASVATQIAQHIGVEYADMFGRGSLLREACRAVRESLVK